MTRIALNATKTAFKILDGNGLNIGVIVGVAVAVFIVTGVGAFIYYRYFWEHNQVCVMGWCNYVQALPVPSYL